MRASARRARGWPPSGPNYLPPHNHWPFLGPSLSTLISRPMIFGRFPGDILKWDLNEKQACVYLLGHRSSTFAADPAASADLPSFAKPQKILWPDQGWDAASANWFHHADQGRKRLWSSCSVYRPRATGRFGDIAGAVVEPRLSRPLRIHGRRKTRCAADRLRAWRRGPDTERHALGQYRDWRSADQRRADLRGLSHRTAHL